MWNNELCRVQKYCLYLQISPIPVIYLHLIFDISSLKFRVWWTGFFPSFSWIFTSRVAYKNLVQTEKNIVQTGKNPVQTGKNPVQTGKNPVHQTQYFKPENVKNQVQTDRGIDIDVKDLFIKVRTMVPFFMNKSLCMYWQCIWEKDGWLFKTHSFTNFSTYIPMRIGGYQTGKLMWQSISLRIRKLALHAPILQFAIVWS